MLSASDIVPPDKRTPGVMAIDPIIFPMLDKLYARRIKRLDTYALAPGENGEYFRFLSHLVNAQRQILEQTPLVESDIQAIQALLGDKTDDARFEASLSNIECWQVAYATLIKNITPLLPQNMRDNLDNLAADKSLLVGTARALLQSDYQQVNAGVAVVLWAALSTCWAQAVEQEPRVAQPVAHAVSCPCCHAPPVASLVLGGAREGLRYLQCSLCETRWHRVRAVCVDCGASGQMDHWTLDDAKSAIQIETCGDCKEYIKTFRLDYDPELEATADDLGSFSLDRAIEAEGFVRIGLSPFSFPA